MAQAPLGWEVYLSEAHIKDMGCKENLGAYWPFSLQREPGVIGLHMQTTAESTCPWAGSLITTHTTFAGRSTGRKPLSQRADFLVYVSEILDQL